MNLDRTSHTHSHTHRDARAHTYPTEEGYSYGVTRLQTKRYIQSVKRDEMETLAKTGFLFSFLISLGSCATPEKKGNFLDITCAC